MEGDPFLLSTVCVVCIDGYEGAPSGRPARRFKPPDIPSPPSSGEAFFDLLDRSKCKASDTLLYGAVSAEVYDTSVSLSLSGDRDVTRQVEKGVWRMPRLSQAMKDVTSCDKLRGGANDL